MHGDDLGLRLPPQMAPIQVNGQCLSEVVSLYFLPWKGHRAKLSGQGINMMHRDDLGLSLLPQRAQRLEC